MCKLDLNLKNSLSGIKYFLLDLDGTLYLDGKPIGDMANTLKFLRDNGKKLIYLTNNSSKSVDKYVERLKNIDFYQEGDIVYSSGLAAIEYINLHYKGAKVFLLGTKSLKEDFIKGGITLTDGDDADIALMAFDTELTYDKLVMFVRNLKNGAKYIATHPDKNCPAEHTYIPDVGSFIKMVEEALGYTPELIIGKPNTVMGENLMVKFSSNDKKEFMMVGDRLYTDIAFGINCGFYSLLVLSGETNAKMLETAPEKPSFILDTFNDIKNYF